MAIKTVTLTTLVTNDEGDWLAIPCDLNQPRQNLVLQGYWAGCTGTTKDGTITVDLTMDKAAANAYDMYSSADVVTIDSASEAFTFNINNRGFRFLRTNIVLNSIAQINTVKYFTNTEVT